MKTLQRSLLVTSLLLAAPLAFAITPADYVHAQKILNTVLDATAKLKTQAVVVEAPKPLADKSGKYFVPYTEKGELTAWAQKAVNAQAGAAVGSKLGEEAGKHLIAKIPFGGMFAGAAKKKGKELGAIAAVGGADFIKNSSDFSFENLDDYAVYLHVTYSSSADYAQALATAMSIYPELEARYQAALQKAFAAASASPKVAAK